MLLNESQRKRLIKLKLKQTSIFVSIFVILSIFFSWISTKIGGLGPLTFKYSMKSIRDLVEKKSFFPNFSEGIINALQNMFNLSNSNTVMFFLIILLTFIFVGIFFLLVAYFHEIFGSFFFEKGFKKLAFQMFIALGLLSIPIMIITQIPAIIVWITFLIYYISIMVIIKILDKIGVVRVE